MDYIAIDTNSFRYISHHGILGQKWGVRRYQNPDGSLTPAGRVKYREHEMKIQSKEKNWRDREIDRVNKKYSIDKYDKKIEKAELKGKTVKAEVLKDKKRISEKSYAI